MSESKTITLRGDEVYPYRVQENFKGSGRAWVLDALGFDALGFSWDADKVHIAQRHVDAMNKAYLAGRTDAGKGTP